MESRKTSKHRDVASNSIGHTAASNLQESTNPLLVSAVAKQIFVHLEKGDILKARWVCKDWLFPATENCFHRKSIQVVLNETEASIPAFIKRMKMERSAGVPASRFVIGVNLSCHHSSSIIQLLIFIAPFVKSISLSFSSISGGKSGLGRNMQTQRLMKHFSELNESFTQLEELRITWQKTAWSGTEFQRTAVTILVEKIVTGAPDLTTFINDFPFGTGELMGVLPKGLKKLCFASEGPFPDYRELFNCRLTLEELSDRRKMWDGLLVFLHQQKAILRRLNLAYLEQLISDTLRQNLPAMEACTTLTTTADCKSRLKFLSLFPSLVELNLFLSYRGEPSNLSNLPTLPQHEGIRRLSCVLYYPLKMPVFQFTCLPSLWAHTFPNLTHASFKFSDHKMWPQLEPIFRHLISLKSLALRFCGGGDPSYCLLLEAVFAGVEAGTCKLIRERGIDNVPSSMIEGGTLNAGGLANLRELRSIEIHANPDQYDSLFTEATLDLGFMKMKSLKEIRVVLDKELYNYTTMFKTLRSYGKKLREKGVEFYRMKRGF